MIVSDVKSKRYQVWVDEGNEYPHEGLGWKVVKETDDFDEAMATVEVYNYSYVEDTFG